MTPRSLAIASLVRTWNPVGQEGLHDLLSWITDCGAHCYSARLESSALLPQRLSKERDQFNDCLPRRMLRRKPDRALYEFTLDIESRRAACRGNEGRTCRLAVATIFRRRLNRHTSCSELAGILPADLAHVYFRKQRRRRLEGILMPTETVRISPYP